MHFYDYIYQSCLHIVVLMLIEKIGTVDYRLGSEELLLLFSAGLIVSFSLSIFQPPWPSCCGCYYPQSCTKTWPLLIEVSDWKSPFSLCLCDNIRHFPYLVVSFIWCSSYKLYKICVQDVCLCILDNQNHTPSLDFKKPNGTKSQK